MLRSVYLRGTYPTEYVNKLHATSEYLMRQFIKNHDSFESQCRGFRDVNFWFTFLVAGSRGVLVVEDASLTGTTSLSLTRYCLNLVFSIMNESCTLCLSAIENTMPLWCFQPLERKSMRALQKSNGSLQKSKDPLQKKKKLAEKERKANDGKGEDCENSRGHV
ncbi:hypothetical protein GOP47_0008996 [Adiantum capillus-veneris]|uniref:Uncharacterized protein n=1 Tax=Adiantum capillus-veneris TaxID=13818 RepID=A0A9D4ZKW3_ADICA|nr:hypothetical protein GOP47_0008996 [Adiantum capillus-veneris]